jgi:hypothetical protein
MRLARFIASALVLAVAGPAAANDQRVWAIATPKDADAVLRYAFLNTDDLVLGLTCSRKTGQVRVIAASPVRLNEMRDPDAPPSTPVLLKRKATVMVSSGEFSASVPGQVGPDGENGGSYIMTELSTQSPIFDAFRKTGRLRVVVQREAVDAPPAPVGMARKFLGYCG